MDDRPSGPTGFPEAANFQRPANMRKIDGTCYAAVDVRVHRSEIDTRGYGEEDSPPANFAAIKPRAIGLSELGPCGRICTVRNMQMLYSGEMTDEDVQANEGHEDMLVLATLWIPYDSYVALANECSQANQPGRLYQKPDPWKFANDRSIGVEVPESAGAVLWMSSNFLKSAHTNGRATTGDRFRWPVFRSPERDVQRKSWPAKHQSGQLDRRHCKSKASGAEIVVRVFRAQREGKLLSESFASDFKTPSSHLFESSCLGAQLWRPQRQSVFYIKQQMHSEWGNGALVARCQ